MITEQFKILSVMTISLRPYGTFVEIKDYNKHIEQSGEDVPIVVEGCLHTYGGNSHFRVGIYDQEAGCLAHAEFVDFGDNPIDFFWAKKRIADKVLGNPALKAAVLGETPRLYFKNGIELLPIFGVASLEDARRFIPVESHRRIIESNEKIYMDPKSNRVDFASKWGSLARLVEVEYDIGQEQWTTKKTH